MVLRAGPVHSVVGRSTAQSAGLRMAYGRCHSRLWSSCDGAPARAGHRPAGAVRGCARPSRSTGPEPVRGSGTTRGIEFLAHPSNRSGRRGRSSATLTGTSLRSARRREEADSTGWSAAGSVPLSGRREAAPRQYRPRSHE